MTTWIAQRRRLLGLTACLVLVAAAAGAAYAVTVPKSGIVTSTPRSANDITNIDVLRQQLRNYYGDPNGTGVFSPTSNYAKEAASVAADGGRYLADRAGHPHGPGGPPGPPGPGPVGPPGPLGPPGPPGHPAAGTPAIVLDVDDTTLSTWSYEIASNWDYNPATNTTAVLAATFPAVPGMVSMVNAAKAEGYTIFVITGRPDPSQRSATETNLTNDGYPAVPDADVFLKPATTSAYPAYLTAACSGDPSGVCTTDHYKAATRQHIESMGFDIVANFGDQFSDFSGGFEDMTFKLPNPNYFLP